MSLRAGTGGKLMDAFYGPMQSAAYNAESAITLAEDIIRSALDGNADTAGFKILAGYWLKDHGRKS